MAIVRGSAIRTTCTIDAEIRAVLRQKHNTLLQSHAAAVAVHASAKNQADVTFGAVS